ncbi:50S ribosomal protein L3 [Candidatus Woesearchaeota archaeon]|nr:50S ribosomal protein L3 [Candidatus Woesearchaeota archaeon]
MPNTRKPRCGSLQFLPKKRAKKAYARVHSWTTSKEALPLAFAGYKAGMTHIIFVDKRNNRLIKNEKRMWPVTVIECPPMTIHSARFYKKSPYGKKLITEVLNSKPKKHLKRKLVIPKTLKTKFEDITDFDEITVVVHTNPDLTGIGKKKPEIFEVGLGGSKENKFNYVKENLGKDLNVKDILKEGMLTDIHAITAGKGYQGPVKRFGISLKSHKSEKARRAAVQGPEGYAKVLFTIPKGGKMGFHQRTDYNKLILKINEKVDMINPNGGFVRYGELKNPYLLIKGSIPCPSKRLAILTRAIRPNKKISADGVNITYISKESKQGR